MKVYRVSFRATAEDDLFRLYEYIADKSGSLAAGRYVDRIEAACMSLSQAPKRGRSREDIRPGLRTLRFEGRALIVFTVGERDVEIVRVLYGGRDFEALLSGAEEDE